MANNSAAVTDHQGEPFPALDQAARVPPWPTKATRNARKADKIPLCQKGGTRACPQTTSLQAQPNPLCQTLLPSGSYPTNKQKYLQFSTAESTKRKNDTDVVVSMFVGNMPGKKLVSSGVKARIGQKKATIAAAAARTTV